MTTETGADFACSCASVSTAGASSPSSLLSADRRSCGSAAAASPGTSTQASAEMLACLQRLAGSYASSINSAERLMKNRCRRRQESSGEKTGSTTQHYDGFLIIALCSFAPGPEAAHGKQYDVQEAEGGAHWKARRTARNASPAWWPAVPAPPAAPVQTRSQPALKQTLVERDGQAIAHARAQLSAHEQKHGTATEALPLRLAQENAPHTLPCPAAHKQCCGMQRRLQSTSHAGTSAAGRQQAFGVDSLVMLRTCGHRPPVIVHRSQTR